MATKSGILFGIKKHLNKLNAKLQRRQNLITYKHFSEGTSDLENVNKRLNSSTLSNMFKSRPWLNCSPENS
jgi:hypothetical protein